MEKGTGIAIGIGIGATIGFVSGNLGFWFAIGVILGVLIENGAFDEWAEDWKC